MATIDEQNHKVIFDDDEIKAAWNNSPKITNLDQTKFRLCYLCKLPVDLSLPVDKTTKTNRSLGWIVDLLNAKKMDFSPKNLVIIHSGCLDLRTKLDQRKIYRKVNELLWEYQE